MQKLTQKQNKKYPRKDRGWLFLNGIVYSVFGIHAAIELLALSAKTTTDYVANGIILVVAILASIIYWKSFNMYLILLVDRFQIRGWWQEINIVYMDIDKCEKRSRNYSDSYILYLKRPISKIFRFSSKLPLRILEKDHTVIALSSFVSEQDWSEFERIVCRHLI